MIKNQEITPIDFRLNNILDKILSMGISSLDDDDIKFLESFSIGNESEINKILSENENTKTFISDDGLFRFKLSSIDYLDNIKYINGVITVPDMLVNKHLVKGELYGSIIVFSNNNIAIDFHRGKYDIFEFVSKIEYELDCFVDDIIETFKKSDY